MIWHLIRYLVSFSIPAFYKKIEGKNADHLMKVKGPAIIAMNHPNAFMDPVCFTWVSFPLKVRYMARGDAFKPGLASFLLEQLGIVPIFRLRDGGKEGLQKNDESYQRINTLLKRNKKVIIFAEGLCIQERRLRPLKKGVARMVFGAHDFLNHKNLVVIPVGVNYSNPSLFRSKLFYNIGEPIKINDFESVYNENPKKAYNDLLKLLTTKMQKLVTHIQDKQNDQLIVCLEEMVMQEWQNKLQHPQNLAGEFEVSNYLTEVINTTELSQPLITEQLRQQTEDYFQLLKKHKVRDWIINPLNKYKVTKQHYALRTLFWFITLPVNALGYLAAFLPYKLTVKLTKAVVKRNKEFYSSMAIGFGTFIFLINFLLWFIFIYLSSPNVLWPLCLTALLMLCAWQSMLLHYFHKKTMGMKRILFNPVLKEELSIKREALMNLINGLTNFQN
jgi:glycerol-3-phosphate O-acyltransferase / dihydroxyacetone phosphate acyltransferase